MFVFQVDEAVNTNTTFHEVGTLFFKNAFGDEAIFAEIKMPVGGWTTKLLVDIERSIAAAHNLEAYDMYLGEKWVGSSEL